MRLGCREEGCTRKRRERCYSAVWIFAFLEVSLGKMGLCIRHGTTELPLLQPSLVEMAIALSLSQAMKAASSPLSIN